MDATTYIHIFGCFLLTSLLLEFLGYKKVILIVLLIGCYKEFTDTSWDWMDIIGNCIGVAVGCGFEVFVKKLKG